MNRMAYGKSEFLVMSARIVKTVPPRLDAIDLSRRMSFALNFGYADIGHGSHGCDGTFDSNLPSGASA